MLKLLSDIPWSFDPAACILALVGVAIALMVYRRSFSVVLRIEHTYGPDLRRTSPPNVPCQFRVQIKNLGITLHSPEVAIKFFHEGKIRTIRMHRFQIDTGAKLKSLPEFPHGMVAGFSTSDKDLSESSSKTIEMLANAKMRKVYLVVYSQSLIAKRIKLGTVIERLKWAWNWQMNYLHHRMLRSGTAQIDWSNTYQTWKVPCPTEDIRHFAVASIKRMELLLPQTSDDNEIQNFIPEPDKISSAGESD